jgi:class 3 adenylate cyclase
MSSYPALSMCRSSGTPTRSGPSQVLASQTVRDLVVGSGLTFDDAGERELKGVPGRRRLYVAAG